MSGPRAEVVTEWNRRAPAYAELVRRHPVFARLADRLVDFVPAEAGEALDVGAGTGLVSERLLRARPDLRVHLCEPAEGMLALAAERLGPRPASFSALAAEEVDRDPRPVDAALASACLHLSDWPASLRAIAARLRPGGVLAFNLWWHAWEPTAGEAEPADLWRAPLLRALDELRVDPGLLPEPEPRRPPITPAALAAAARAAGFALEVLDPDRDAVDAALLVDFAAMGPALRGLREREAVFARARALAAGEATWTSTRFRLTRRR